MDTMTDPATGAGAAQTDIDTLRNQIDALDTAIARLVGERAQLSRRIQTARMNAGGTRVELGRERDILAHYRAVLGADGSALADAVLRVCRGAR
jgi:chorismate mutase